MLKIETMTGSHGRTKWNLKGFRKDYATLHSEVIEILGNKCARCGFSDKRALQIDHKNGFGTQHWKQAHFTVIFQQIKDNPDEYQCLCANCNWIKRAENRETAAGYRYGNAHTPADTETKGSAATLDICRASQEMESFA